MNILRAAVTAAAVLTLAPAGAAHAAAVTSVEADTASDHALLVSGATSVPAASEVRVSENGRVPTGLRVSSAGAAALRSPVVLVVPSSRSWAFAAAREIASERTLAPGVVTYSRAVVTIAAPVGSEGASRDALAGPGVDPAGARSLDAVATAVDQLDGGGTVVVLAGQADAGSKRSQAEVAAAARKAGVTVDVIAAPAARASLAPLAQSTGGLVSPVALQADGTADQASALDAAEQVSGRIGSGYLVTWASKAAGTRDLTLTAPGVARSFTVHEAALAASTTVATSGGGPAPALIAAIAALLGLAVFLVLRARAPREETFESRVAAWIVPPSSGDDAFITDAAPVTTSATEPTRRSRLADALDLGGFALTPEAFIARAAIATLLFGVGGYFLAAPYGAALLIAGPIGARFILKNAATRRRNRFAGQLADTIQGIASAMRAGHGLSGALAMVAEDSPEPVASELLRAVSAERLGVPLDEALDEVTARMRSRDLEQVALVASLQRDVGGNAAEALDQIVDTIRGRDDMRRLVNSLTAQGRMSRWVLTFLPAGLAVVTSLMTKGYMDPMIHTSTGLMISAGAASSVMLGSWIIGKIVEIDV